MAEVKVLVEGVAGKESWSTVTLVEEAGKRYIVDPGNVAPEKLLAALKEEGVAPSDIDTVCITHAHLDHYRNIGLFPEASVLDYWGLWEGTHLQLHKEEWQVSEALSILYTPGHSEESVTFLVKTEDGLIGICGDLFWFEEGPEKDEYASDHELLLKNRNRLKERVDSIIPGHGQMFQARK